MEVHDQVEVDRVLESKVQLGQPGTAAAGHDVALLFKERNLQPHPPLTNITTVSWQPLHSKVVTSALRATVESQKLKKAIL